ncbi:ABC transporter ATP-binding protein [Egicoccus sp. AB-alg2]|uniref:ABC transporter ATP-binding protein n=1 Tax=Egicoccus sp. AB-alg2 TaxID=3242693 RepID=UPI00359F12D5
MTNRVEEPTPVKATPAAADTPLLEVDELTVEFPVGGGRWLPIVDRVSFSLHRGEALGFVGESGSGKTMSARALLGLVPRPGRVRGSVRLRGREVVGLGDREWTKIRSREIGMVFQDAMSGLNPVRTVGSTLIEVARRTGIGRKEARARAIEVLDAVGIPSPVERLDVYPHQLSGGLRQRIMIALAIINEPSIIIADEPTTALDATIQAQIMERLRALLGDRALMLITHDMGVAASLCDRIQVIYAGRMAEAGTARQVMQTPRHPYTAGLLRAVPKFDRSRTPLVPIPGVPPRAGTVGDACAFAPRCANATDACRDQQPPFAPVDGRLLACYHPWGLSNGSEA